MSNRARQVIVITGAGGMGLAVARRLGPGHAVVVGDSVPGVLDRALAELRADGLDVHVHLLDVASERSVEEFAEFATSFGALRAIVHTAGVSPVQAPPAQIVAVDIIGTALMLDHFLDWATEGTVMICIASMAGHMRPVDRQLELAFAVTPTHELASIPEIDPARIDSAAAYSIAKRANQMRVRAVAHAWGAKGARVLSISPGIIATPMGRAELEGPSGDLIRDMIDSSPVKRIGTPDDVAAAVEFLASDHASFITGTDLLVDGGAIAVMSTR